MTEDFLHFIWKYGLFDRNSLVTDCKENVEIIRLGEHNADAGPDFLNARIKIDQTVWAGNVEIHVRSSDWKRHNHQANKAFDNVILQVVYQYDLPAVRTSQEHIPTVELKFENRLFESYRNLLGNTGRIPCRDKIDRIDPVIFECWLHTLAIERLQQKNESISLLLAQNKNDWEEAFYVFLARSFGFGINSTPFELLARSIPLKCLARHKGNLFQIEALLFGQAGFLDLPAETDRYYTAARKEYAHLQRKYRLKPIEKHLWKFLRIHPQNFPTVRIGQLASLINQSSHLFSKMIECEKIEELYQIYSTETSEYWKTHYNFDKLSAKKTKRLGMESINIIIINAVIPFLFAYGTLYGIEKLKTRAIEWLENIPPERNRIVNHWADLGFHPSSAFYSQGLLELTNHYCKRKRCLACSIGTKIITTGIE